MPFQTDNAWPAGLLDIFSRARTIRPLFRSRYCGPYDKLLNYCFGDSLTLSIAPWHSPLDENDGCDAIDPFVLVVSDKHARPLLIFDVKEDGWAENAVLRSIADAQMRTMYNWMLHDCPIPRLWGLSLLGTKMRVFYGDKATREVHPPPIARPDPSHGFSRTFLAGEWDTDILSETGFTKVKEIVTDILDAYDD